MSDHDLETPLCRDSDVACLALIRLSRFATPPWGAAVSFAELIA